MPIPPSKLDREFQLAVDFDYNIQWIEIMKELINEGLMQKGNGYCLTKKGNQYLSQSIK